MKTIKYLVPMQEFVLEVDEEEFDHLKDISENGDLFDLNDQLDWFTSDLDIALDGPYFIEGD